MKFSLRRANELEKLALEAASKAGLSTELRISVFDNQSVEAMLDTARDKVKQSILDKLALIDAAFAIRALASDAMRDAGITKLLLEKAHVERKERILSAYASDTAAREKRFNTIQVLDEKIKSMKTRLETRATRMYGDDDEQETVSTPVLRLADTEKYADQIAALKHRTARIHNELMTRNWEHEIDIPKSVLDVLKQHKIDVSE